MVTPRKTTLIDFKTMKTIRINFLKLEAKISTTGTETVIYSKIQSMKVTISPSSCNFSFSTKISLTLKPEKQN